MKKLLPLLILFFGYVTGLKAQCSQVTLDASVVSSNSNTYNINTTNANELIMISYNGWNGPGNGPVSRWQ